MLMNNPLVQSPGWWSLPKKKRFEMASAQSMLSPLAQVQTPQYDYTMDDNAGPKTPHIPMAGKKGLSLKNMINAMSKMKQPTGMDFGKAGGRVGSNQLAKFSPIPGLNPNYDYGYGGLDFDPLKRQKKMMGSLV